MQHLNNCASCQRSDRSYKCFFDLRAFSCHINLNFPGAHLTYPSSFVPHANHLPLLKSTLFLSLYLLDLSC